LEVARDPNCPHEVYIEAIRHNMRLWTIFQVSVADPECPLPHEVRVNLFKLSRYVDKVSFAAIARKDLEGIASLIQINRQIAAGLSAGAKMDRPPDVPAAPAEPVQITT
jgi:flagellar protein FlaF